MHGVFACVLEMAGSTILAIKKTANLWTLPLPISQAQKTQGLQFRLIFYHVIAIEFNLYFAHLKRFQIFSHD